MYMDTKGQNIMKLYVLPDEFKILTPPPPFDI